MNNSSPASTSNRPTRPAVGHRAVAPPPPERPRPPERRRKPLIVLIGIGVLAVALVFGFVGSALLRDTKGDVVIAYLNAIREGKAAAALAHGATPAADSSLLTDEVLRRSAELAPITDVTVAATTSNSVMLSMRVGGQPRQVTYPVVQVDGVWKVVEAARTFKLAADPGLIPIVNGAAPAHPTLLTLFPGTYEFTTGTPHLQWAIGRQQLLLGNDPQTPDLELEVPDGSVEAARKVVVDDLTTCVGRTEMAPSGCPFKMTPPAGITVTPKSIRWSLSGTPEWVPAPVGATLVGRVSYSLRLQFDYTANGQRGTYDKTTAMQVDVTADLSKDPITIVYGG